jgi:phosphomannomutase/phosphoglucomutase
MTITPHAFRQYDIRGMVTHELPISEMYRLGCAIAAYIIQKNPQAKTIIIGRDGRTHSPDIHRCIVQALFDCGFALHDTGLCPTPVVYFAAHTRNYDAAVMITASHNGPEYNGLKLCLGKNSIWGSEIQEIQRLYLHQAKESAEGTGSYQRVAIQQEYCDYMAAAFSDLKDFDKPVLADCGNGAVGAVLRDVIDAVGLPRVTILCEEVDGNYPNHTANPVELENMLHVAEQVLNDNAFFAVGFDGDGDRMAAMTHEGQLLAGDQLLSLFAIDVLSRNPGAKIVFDGKCLLIVQETIKKYGGHFFRSPSGHTIIKAAMREHQALLGGELSCHFFFADDYFGFDDGIYAFLRLIRLIKNSQKSLAELVSQFPQTLSTPEIRVFCEDMQKERVMHEIKNYFLGKAAYTLSFDDGVRFENEHGWGLIRASNTQPALCIRYESLTQKEFQEFRKTVYDAIHMAFVVMNIDMSGAQTMKELV